MRVLPQRGMPPRESFQDRVAQEMVLRERRGVIATNRYLAQCITAGYALNPDLFAFWTLQYADEISHANYRPEIMKIKRRQLDELEKKKRYRPDHISRVQSYALKSAKDMMPYSKAELEEKKSAARARDLKRAQGK